MKKRLQTSQRQRQRTKMKPLHVALAVTALTGILVTVLIIVFNIGTPERSLAAGGCSSCTYTVNGNNSQSYSLNRGQTLCISESGSYMGEVNINGGGTVCNSGTFAPSSISFGWGAILENSGTAIMPSGFSNVGTVNNSGNLTLSGNFSNSGTFNNTGVVTSNGNFTNSSSGSAGMTTGNQMTVNGDFTNQNDLENNGLLAVTGYFENANSGSASFTNNDSLYVGKYFNNYQNFTNNGGILVTTNFFNRNSGSAKFYNNGNVYIGGNIQSHQLIQNTGRFTVNGDMTMSNSGSTKTINDSIFVINGNLTSNNRVENNSYMQINGVYTNQQWSGKYVAGPESLLEVDSMYNQSNIENYSTPYGQIVIFGYMSNTGNIANYVDICKSGGGSAFDVNSGSVNDDVTYCTNNSPLPVELIAFTAKRSEGAVLLEWATASEMNNRLFEVQRRIEDGNFEVIAEVDGAGTTKSVQKYKYIDAASPGAKTIYYRLRQVDFDGEYAYSTIAAVQDKGGMESGHEVKLYPNPVNRQEPIRVELSGEWREANYQVQNMSGNITMEGTINSGGQIATNNLNPGIYLVKIYSGENSRTTKIIVR